MSQPVGTLYGPPKNNLTVFNPAEFEIDIQGRKDSAIAREQWIIENNDAQTIQIADNEDLYDAVFPVNPNLFNANLLPVPSASTNAWINIQTVPTTGDTNIIGNITATVLCPSGINYIAVKVYDPAVLNPFVYLYMYPNFNASTPSTSLTFSRAYVYRASGNPTLYDIYVATTTTTTCSLFPSTSASTNTVASSAISELTITFTP